MATLDNPRHERFAQELAKGKTADEAYQLAGYAENRHNASRLKTNETVSVRVKELQQAAAEKAGLSKAWVIERLMANAERAMQREAVLDEDGKPIGEYRYEGQVVNRALELLGKEIGMFVERAETQNVTYVVSDEPLSRDEWAAEFVTEH